MRFSVVSLPARALHDHRNILQKIPPRKCSLQKARLRRQVPQCWCIDRRRYAIRRKESPSRDFFTHLTNSTRMTSRSSSVPTNASASPALTDRLRSRFEWVWRSTSKCQTWNAAPRQRQGGAQRYNAQSDVVEYLATNFKTNIRELRERSINANLRRDASHHAGRRNRRRTARKYQTRTPTSHHRQANYRQNRPSLRYRMRYVLSAPRQIHHAAETDRDVPPAQWAKMSFPKIA